MKEGVNQGCPLSPIFATLVLHRVLKPVAEQLQLRAKSRVQNNNLGDDGHGSLAHLLAYMDNISTTVAYEDVEFFCTEIDRLGAPRGCFVNPMKTRILTSCSGESIIPLLDETTAKSLNRTIQRYWIKENKDGTSSPIELTTGFCLLGTPVGSSDFAQEYYDEQITTVNKALKNLNKAIPDLHTRLKLFSHCTIQKLPHLLDSDVMHNFPLITTEAAKDWYNWNGPVPAGCDTIINDFLKTILDFKLDDNIPNLACLITSLNTNRGGLGFLNASLRAVPDSTLNIMISKRHSNSARLLITG